MQRTYTPSSTPTSDAGRRCLRQQPRVLTLERVRQFAHAYQAARQLPASISGFVLN